MSRSVAQRVASDLDNRPAYLSYRGAEDGFHAFFQNLAQANATVEHAGAEGRQRALLSAYGHDYSPDVSPEKPFAFFEGAAIIPVHGMLVNRFSSSWGWVTGYNFIRDQVRAALADTDVKSIVFDVHSPGGTVAGCKETYDVIAEATAAVSTIAVVDSSCHSAAYFLAAAAGKIAITPSGDTGSIGVIAMRVDYSEGLAQEGVKIHLIYEGERKADGYSQKPMTDAELARIKEKVADAYSVFVSSVAAGRGMDEQAVRDTEADTYSADEALRLGLVDVIMTPTVAIRACLDQIGSMDEKGKRKMTTETSPTLAEQIAAATLAAQTAERGRLAAITGCEQAKTKPLLAYHLATKTSLSAEDAAGILAAAASEAAPVVPAPVAAPVETAPNLLAPAMAAMGTPGIGADAGGGSGDVDYVAQILSAATAATGQRFGVKGTH